ncbi:hypothetical protein [Novipirellula artificiosorum]|uniref:Uncharacterized protein n=1 Tax=Novipirellula artificiosorum TaxID=2528016 RepID=A0A5C6E1Q4_9BACT|nr:hypothetical protein [Novipirellula artificiosorum]TWU42788.1 hypothetical protein Poly41_10890 [Novipirellula artificiosorum]
MPESTPSETHADIPAFNVETWMYEDFEIGLKRRSIGRTISEGEAMMFKGEGELVMYAEHLQTVKYREPSKWADQVEKK